MTTYKTIAVLVSILFFTGACSTTSEEQKTQPDALRVGVSTEYPPVIFKSVNTISGIEADFAKRLAAELGRPLQFVELAFESLIPALVGGGTDIIMSGMSVTEARRVRINFAAPYLRTQQAALIRIGDSKKYASTESLLRNASVIGVQPDTTGDVYVRRNFPNVHRMPLVRATLAPRALRTGEIDAFVYDAPGVFWMASANEAELLPGKLQSGEEFLAWGVRRGDEELLGAVNSILARWKQDGTLNQILRKWLPEFLVSG